jgi:hypothetical protein
MTREWKGRSGSTPTGSTPWVSSWPALAREGERTELLKYLEERFGIPKSAFDRFLLLQVGKGWWLLRDSAHLEAASRFKVHACGMKAFQTIGQFLKPTTRFIQLFGRFATRSVVQLTEEELLALQEGEGMQAREPLENGYVLLVLDRQAIIGLGLLIHGVIRLQVRKSDLPQRSDRIESLL